MLLPLGQRGEGSQAGVQSGSRQRPRALRVMVCLREVPGLGLLGPHSQSVGGSEGRWRFLGTYCVLNPRSYLFLTMFLR